jgi:AraC family transcriptional regulator of adaptative response / DNA-3-methyladenine glycosylase II
MTLDDRTCYRALTARDARFDGVFFVGVRTTGIYCRPVCTAKRPARESCRFFASAALAERHGFRPCLRCRPELAPGHAPVDWSRNVARLAAARIEAGELTGSRLVEFSGELGLSDRQLRRVMRSELGISPIELAQTSRLLLAKRLIAETRLSMTQVALASGFESVRRFNALFRQHYRLAPGAMRRAADADDEPHCVRLVLAYRPPFDWQGLLAFLAPRAIAGVEQVCGAVYRRTVAIGEHRGWLAAEPVAWRNQLSVEMSTSLTPVLPQVLARLRRLFDLDARPDVIANHLADDRTLRPLVRRNPGVRVPGAFDGFELAVRAVLGQQVSVRGATTLARRLVEQFGDTIETPWGELNCIAPTAQCLASLRPAKIAEIGMPTARAQTLRTLAAACAAGTLRLEATADREGTVAALEALPGIGAWTTGYIAMRALSWPDAFPHGDLGLLKATGLPRTRALAAVAECWRPWRSYAAMLLWGKLSKARGTTP